MRTWSALGMASGRERTASELSDVTSSSQSSRDAFVFSASRSILFLTVTWVIDRIFAAKLVKHYLVLVLNWEDLLPVVPMCESKLNK